MNTDFIRLTDNMINMELFSDFHRHQVVTKCHRKINGEWVVIDNPFVEDWGEKEFEYLVQCLLIPQNSKRGSESKEGMNPAITSSESKAEFTSVHSQMAGNENKIINYGTNPAAFDGAVADGHIIFLH